MLKKIESDQNIFITLVFFTGLLLSIHFFQLPDVQVDIIGFKLFGQTKLREVDQQQIKTLIERNKLSGRKAKHWVPYEGP